VPVIFITGHGDVPMSVRAMKAGAIEFLTKPFREQDLLDAIYAGLAQSRQRLAREAEHDDLRRRHASLSPRECEVMAMIVDEGLQSKQIAAKLGLSEVTVKLCRGSLMKKLGAASPVDLGMMAERLKGALTLLLATPWPIKANYLFFLMRKGTFVESTICLMEPAH
jgi:FixJ family two-component response regulator